MLERQASTDLLQARAAFDIEPCGVDAFTLRQIPGKLLQAFPQLTFGAQRVSLLMMIETYGEVNHALQKEAARTAFGPPKFFEDFMTFEEVLAVEKLDAALECHLAGCLRNHSRVRRSPCSNVKPGVYPRPERAAVVSACE